MILRKQVGLTAVTIILPLEKCFLDSAYNIMLRSVFSFKKSFGYKNYKHYDTSLNFSLKLFAEIYYATQICHSCLDSMRSELQTIRSTTSEVLQA